MKYTGLLLASILPMTLAYEWRVGVGKDETTGRKGKGFDPSVITPQQGDYIAFEFRSGVHSAVQSTFDNPCVGNDGFNSGVHTVADDLDVDAPGLPVVRLLINGSEPLWFFDEAGGLCYQGAVLSVNPTSSQTPTAFIQNAAQPPKPKPSTSTTSSGSAATESPKTESDATKGNNGAASKGIAWLLTAAGLAMGAYGVVA
ncbi:hypothetical protein D9611_000848 [Ephemerocybe angulata]|uniref:Uncharacterized protein n=2 Tax=Ephemerocybe angulata TaxID=980116 RepID=A0A8H6HNJ9_9AGAR|nr:hypothetical protein D9611_000848 [Tulosesus angulatus]KAF6749602.1 hypothetical protein DFP72DRAFT_913043 [Tulosesus angulatus]